MQSSLFAVLMLTLESYYCAMSIHHFVLGLLCRNVYSQYILEILILIKMFAIASVLCFHLPIMHIYFSRQLQCDRVTLHKNLFSSYILNASAWILYYTLASFNVEVLAGNPVSETVFLIYIIPKRALFDRGLDDKDLYCIADASTWTTDEG